MEVIEKDARDKENIISLDAELLTEESLDAALNEVFRDTGNSFAPSTQEKPLSGKAREQNNLRLALNRNGLSTGDIARNLAGIAKNSDNDRTRLQALEIAMQAQGLLAKEIEEGKREAPVINIVVNPLTAQGVRDSLSLFVPA